jgi:hypothetical protein
MFKAIGFSAICSLLLISTLACTGFALAQDAPESFYRISEKQIDEWQARFKTLEEEIVRLQTSNTKLAAENTQLKYELYGDPTLKVEPLYVDGKATCAIKDYVVSWFVIEEKTTKTEITDGESNTVPDESKNVFKPYCVRTK